MISRNEDDVVVEWFGERRGRKATLWISPESVELFKVFSGEPGDVSINNLNPFDSQQVAELFAWLGEPRHG